MVPSMFFSRLHLVCFARVRIVNDGVVNRMRAAINGCGLGFVDYVLA